MLNLICNPPSIGCAGSLIHKVVRSKLRVLVPGVGLGRLAFDVAHLGEYCFHSPNLPPPSFNSLGFASQGNEYSHYMLLASYFMLNEWGFLFPTQFLRINLGYSRTTEINQHRIYPYIHSFSNATCRDDILHPVLIPDVVPTSLPSGSPFSLIAGQSIKCFDLTKAFIDLMGIIYSY